MARPPDDSLAVPARHHQTSPLSVKMTLRCFSCFGGADFADGGLSFSIRKETSLPDCDTIGPPACGGLG